MARAKVADERREQILAAFECCVIREGLSKTTLQDVANEAALPRSLIRYFIGNKAAMVDLIIDRMVERAEQQLWVQVSDDSNQSFASLLDFVLNKVFSDPTSNAIIGELWYLSEKNSGIKQRLAELYLTIKKRLVDQMKREKIGRDIHARRDFAQTVISLAYGNASFTYLGLEHCHPKHALIDALLHSLKN